MTTVFPWRDQRFDLASGVFPGIANFFWISM